MTILTSATLAALITSNNCGSPVVALVMVGISRHKSGLIALAIYDNVTERRYAPTSTAEAVRTASSLLGLGHSVDAGIAQVNSKNGLGSAYRRQRPSSTPAVLSWGTSRPTLSQRR
jgi:hypothetical protein